MTFFIDYAEKCENIGDLLLGGLILPSCDFCCPDCEPYMLVPNKLFVDYVTGKFGNDLCCFNYATNGEGYAYLDNNIGEILPPRGFYGEYSVGEGCENNNFIECLPELESVVNSFSETMIRGLVEHSTINGNSALCALASSMAPYDIAFNTKFLEIIQTYGLVISCEKGNIRFTSLEGYISLLTKGGTPLQPVGPKKPIKPIKQDTPVKVK